MPERRKTKIKVLMVGPSKDAKGGIATIAQLYLNSDLMKLADINYIMSYFDGSVFRKIIVAVRAYISFLSLLILKSPDIIHVHSSSGVSFYRKMLFLLTAKIFQKKTIFHLNASNFMQFYNRTALNRFFVQMTLNLVDRILVLSRSIKNDIENCTKNQNIKILYNPISPDMFSFSSNKKQKQQESVVLFMGRLGKRKGIYDLLEAIPLVVRECKEVKFILCGDGELENVQCICHKKKIGNNVEIAGWVVGKDKVAYFKRGDIYVLPTYHEALPLSILEAMAVGLPVVSTPVAGIPDAVEDGVNGFLIEPGDIVALANRIILLLQNDKLRIEMGRNNIKKVKEKFDIDLIIKKVLQEYKSLLT